MSFLSKLFGRKETETTKVGGMEDFMTLIRVYFQASLASQVGITNLAYAVVHEGRPAHHDRDNGP